MPSGDRVTTQPIRLIPRPSGAISTWPRIRREQQGDDAGQQHARRHVVVNRQHVRPKARIAGGARNANRRGVDAGRARVLPIGHVISFARAKGPFATAEYIVDARRDFKRN